MRREAGRAHFRRGGLLPERFDRAAAGVIDGEGLLAFDQPMGNVIGDRLDQRSNPVAL